MKTDIDPRTRVLMSRQLIPKLGAHSAIVESYRMLRTSVLAAAREDGLSTFLVTSAGRGEGKSVTSCNLALSLAELEQRVLLLDCDLRMPTVGRMFGLGLGPVSLDDVVSPNFGFDHARFDSGIVHVTPHLDVFRASEQPMLGPAEFLASSSMDVVLDAVRSRYDAVVIDSPPAGLVTDATILSGKVDAVLFVLSHGQTNRRFVRRALRELTRADANVIGTVMNQFPVHRAHVRRAQGYLGGGYSSLPAVAPQA